MSVNGTGKRGEKSPGHRNDVEVTSAVSCLWASLAATKCWESSSFSTAYWEGNAHAIKSEQKTKTKNNPTKAELVDAPTHRLGFLLKIDDLRQQVCDLLLLPGGVLGLSSQLLRDGRDLKTREL